LLTIVNETDVDAMFVSLNAMLNVGVPIIDVPVLKLLFTASL
jgi:hypothetical protein